MAESSGDLAALVVSLNQHFTQWGLTMTSKTELLSFGAPTQSIDVGPFVVDEANDLQSGGTGAGVGNF
eukprot:2276230-Pyramimonas_sp.AAC.1